MLLLLRVTIVLGRWVLREPSVRPGDWVRLGADAVGTVATVGLRRIRISTADQRELIVPSGRVSTLRSDVAALSERCLLEASLGLLNTRTSERLEAVRSEVARVLFRYAETSVGETVVSFVRTAETELRLDVTVRLSASQYRDFRRWRREVVSEIARLAGRDVSFVLAQRVWTGSCAGT